MHMRTFVGLCAALAFAAGSPAVHALKIVDNRRRSCGGRQGQQHLRQGNVVVDCYDGCERRERHGDVLRHRRERYLALGAGRRYGQCGGYLRRQLHAGRHGIPGDGGERCPDWGLVGTFTVAHGGAAGDKAVVFRLASNSSVATTATRLVLSAEFAVSAAGSGSVTRTVTNQTLAMLNIPGVDGTMTHTASGAILLGSGLKETSMANSPTATVEHGFRSFGGDAVATVGSLQVTFNGEVRQATSATGAVVNDLNQVIDNSGTGDDAMSTVEIMGNFSFATNAFLHGDNDCSAEGTTTPRLPQPLAFLRWRASATT